MQQKGCDTGNILLPGGPPFFEIQWGANGFHIKMHQKGCDTGNILLPVGPPLIQGTGTPYIESYRGNKSF